MDRLAQPTEQLDLMLAYLLGDVTEEERMHVEILLSSGEPEISNSFQLAMTAFAELPRALTAAVPPPFVKERIMDRVHEDVAAYVAPSRTVNFVRVPILTRILNLLPGYGSTQVKIASRPRSGYRRAAGFAFMLLAGFFATAYGIEAVSHVVQRADDAQAKVIDRVRHTKAFADRFTPATTESSVLPQIASENRASMDIRRTQHSMAIAPQLQPTIRAVNPVSADAHSGMTLAQSKGTPIPQNVAGDRMPLDITSLEGALYFMSDKSGLHFSLKPVNNVAEGKALIYWNAAHSEALFSAQDLKPTEEDQRYSLCYVLDDGTREQISSFESIGGGYRQMTMKRTPGPHVVGAQLLLESGVKSGRVSREVILAATTRQQNK
jgi:hypothetical protein